MRKRDLLDTSRKRATLHITTNNQQVAAASTPFAPAWSRFLLACQGVWLGQKGVVVGRKGVRLGQTPFLVSHKGVLPTCKGVRVGKTALVLGQTPFLPSTTPLQVGRTPLLPSKTPLETSKKGVFATSSLRCAGDISMATTNTLTAFPLPFQYPRPKSVRTPPSRLVCGVRPCGA